MILRQYGTWIYAKVIFKILFLIQFIILIGIYLHARTPLTWILSTLSFIPTAIICASCNEKKYVLLSLVILFISQQAIFIFANPTWGFCFGSDAINDFHTASVMFETTHFELGQLGYASRLSYSYYPMLHLFSVTLSKVSGLPLISVALYFVPILNGLLTTFALYYLNHDLFGLEGRERNMATLFFEMGFVYTAFQSQFVRETFAFPLVLLSLWTATRISKLRHGRAHVIMLSIFFVAVVLSHHISSYLLFVILAVMALSLNVFHRNNRLNKSLLLLAIMISGYTSFVVLTFFTTQVIYFYEGLQAIFQSQGTPSIMRLYEPWRTGLAYIYYAIICAFTLIGEMKLLSQKGRNWVVITVSSFFVFSFILSVFLRLSTPADPWSFTYYMSLRGTIWAFIGISILLALGIKHKLNLGTHISSKSYFAMLLIVCILAAGKFSQYSLLISDPTIAPAVTYPRYTTALWLREEAAHGSNILVAPYESDMKAFDGSRSMAPYAYLKEYFLDETKGRSYHKFSGYIPLIGGFFDQYTASPNIQVIYSNGDVEVGYKDG